MQNIVDDVVVVSAIISEIYSKRNKKKKLFLKISKSRLKI
jgi:hypothetical protein